MNFKTYNSILLTDNDVDIILDKINKQSLDRLNTLRNFFSSDNKQIIFLLNLIGVYKSSRPLGLLINDLIDLVYMHCQYDMFQSKSYVFSTINRMSQTGLLELRMDGSVDITSLGQEYVLENFKK